jgi:hypothetical protein
MKSRAVRLLVLVAGLFSVAAFGLYLQKEQLDPVVPTQDEFIRIQTETPYDAIYQYYKALEGGNWDLVQSLTTSELWNYINTSDFRSNWEKRIERDPTLRFVLFIVKKQSIDLDEGEGWVMGKVDWTSSQGNVPDDNRTVFLEKQGQSWVISKVISLPAVEVVDDFYEAINAGNLAKARELTTEAYWKKLVAAGVIQGIRKDRARVFGGVYVVFSVDDFTEKEKEAWVTGDVSFNPLTQRGKEVTVNVHVVRLRDQWKIDKIVGHWEMAK